MEDGLGMGSLGLPMSVTWDCPMFPSSVGRLFGHWRSPDWNLAFQVATQVCLARERDRTYSICLLLLYNLNI